MSLPPISWSAKGHDIAAIVATVAATVAHKLSDWLQVDALSDWLQVGVLLLTIIFLILGIIMRIMKIRDSAIED